MLIENNQLARETEVQPALPETGKPGVSAGPANATNFLGMNEELNSSPTRNRALLAVILVGSLVANVTAQTFGLSLFVTATPHTPS